MKCIEANGFDVVVCAPPIDETFYILKVMRDLNAFKSLTDVIVSSCFASELEDVEEKVSTRDMFYGK